MTPLVDPLWIGALGVAALAVIVLGFVARRRGTWLRALAFVLILTALVDPSLVREDRAPLNDVVPVVLDISASQKMGERAQQTSRARDEIEARLKALGNVDVRFIDGGGVDSGDDGTRLFGSLNAALADVPPERIAGAILVTDGVVHDIPANASALGFRGPLHVFVTGHEGERDRRIDLVEAPRFGLVGKDQSLSVRVLDTKQSNEPVAIAVRRDGTKIADVRVRPGQLVRIPIRIDHAGPNVIELDVPVLPDELTALNNKAMVSIEGVRDKLKVLLVSGEPHAGERTWRNLLKSDANVDLVHFTILRPPEKQDGTPINELSLIAFPTADLFGRRIKEFDLIIFDRYSNQTILPPIYFENIVRYVRDGGAMLMAVGPDFAGIDGLYYSPLGKISPARPEGSVLERAFVPRISDDGARHPVSRGLPGSQVNPPAWSRWFRQVNANVLRGTAVLSGADQRPLLVLSREDKGRVGLLLSDQMWLWARGFEGGGPHLDLLRRTAHWLMKEPELEEEALRARSHGKDITIERQSLKLEAASVVLTAPSGATRTLNLAQAEPGLWRAHVVADELGLYRLSDGDLSALVNVGPDNLREFREVVSTLEKLRPLAESTGGTVRRISAGGDEIVLPRFIAMRDSPIYGGADYVGLRRTQASVVTGVGLAPLAIGLVGLLALLGSVLAGWLWEARRKN